MTAPEPTEDVCVEALGVHVRVRVDAALAAELRRTWAWCLSDDRRSPAVEVEVSALRERLETGSDEELFERVTQEVTAAAITARSGELLMLHACAVADPAGRVVVFVGPSGMGKTTLASVLGRRWSYVTDETVALDESGTVLAYPKPLSVRESAKAAKRQVAPAELGLMAPPGDLCAAAVLLLDRRREATSVEVEQIPAIPAVALLAEHTSFLSKLEQPLRRIADLLHRTGGLRRVTYREADQLEPHVAAAMRSAG